MKQETIAVTEQDDIQFDIERMRISIVGPHRTIVLDCSGAPIQFLNQFLGQMKRSSMEQAA